MLADPAHGTSLLSREKAKVLAEKNRWSLAHAEGYVNGELFRRQGKRPPNYLVIGIDEYCLGFRAGYYERNNGGALDFIGRRGLSLKGPTA
jgi:hypothetical protein